MARKVKSEALTERPAATQAAVAARAPAELAPAGFWGRLAALGAVLEQGRTRVDGFDATLGRWAASNLTLSEIARRAGELRLGAGRRARDLGADVARRVDASPGVLLAQAAGVVRPQLRVLSRELHAAALRLEGGPPAAGSAGRS